ncbi:MAG: amidohydrolase [Oligoflexia bacterium]|nr:amidohydrolase [Oligoflexia bacterium]
MTTTTILYNANILKNAKTDFKKQTNQAILIKDNRIAAIESSETLLSLLNSKNSDDKSIVAIDVKNNYILPGFIESHAHILGIGRMKLRLNLSNSKSEEEMVQRVLDYKSKYKNDSWILGRGWDQNLMDKKDLPTNDLLSKLIPDTPVLLTRVDGHAALANKLALQLAKITNDKDISNPVDPAGGKILRHTNGEPTGILIDNAIDLVRNIVPKETIDAKREFLNMAINECLKMGITTLVEAQSDKDIIYLLREFKERGELKIRVYPFMELLDSRFSDFNDLNNNNENENIKGVKIFLDGALGSYGAYLEEPYQDNPSEIGLKTISESDLGEIFKWAQENGIQVAAHALGDGAVKYFLDVYEKNWKAKDLRFRIEHAELINPQDIKRIKELGIILSMQPTHCTSDMHWIEKRIGRDRAMERFCIWKSLLKEGIPLAFGTDAPIESLNPFDTIYAAISRQDEFSWPQNGFNSKERLSINETIMAMTENAAYAIFQEENIGTIAVGKLADIIVIDKNIIDERIAIQNPKELLNTKVLLTMVNGLIHHNAF